MPNQKQKLRIRSLERHGKPVEEVIAGDRAAMNLSGLKLEDFERGMVLTDKPIEETSMIDIYVSLFDTSPELGIWSSIIFQSGTFKCQAKMHLLDKDKIGNSSDAIAQLHLEKPAVLLNKDKFIIRNTSGDITYGGGLIIDTAPLHHRRRTSTLITDLKLLVSGVMNEGNISELIKIELKKVKLPVAYIEIAGKLNSTAEDVIDATEGSIDVVTYISKNNRIIIDVETDRSFYNNIKEIIEEHHHKNHIIMEGLDNNELSGKFGFTKNKIGKEYIELLTEKMQIDEIIQKHNNTWILPNHKPVIDKNTEQEINWLENIIKDFDMQKPVQSEIEQLAKEKNIPKERIKLFLKYLYQNDKIYMHEADFFHKSVVDKSRDLAIAGLSKMPDGAFLGEFRKIINGTKKICPIFARLFESEGIVTVTPVETDLKIKITDKGKETK